MSSGDPSGQVVDERCAGRFWWRRYLNPHWTERDAVATTGDSAKKYATWFHGLNAAKAHSYSLATYACVAWLDYANEHPELDAYGLLGLPTPEPEPTKDESKELTPASSFAQAIADHLERYGNRDNIKNLPRALMWLQSLLVEIITSVLDDSSKIELRNDFVRLGVELQCIAEWAAETGLISPLVEEDDQ